MGTTSCPNHPEATVAKRCARCNADYCAACVTATPRGARCRGCLEPDAAAAPSSSSRTLFIVVLVGAFALLGCPAIIAAIAIPNLIQAKKHGNESSSIGALRTIGTSQTIFREGDKEQDGVLDYGTLSELEQTSLVDPVLGSGTKQGYLYEAAPSTTTSEFLWWAMAQPAVAGTTGDRVFYTNQKGVIFYLVAKEPRAFPRPDPRTCEPPPEAVRLSR